MVLLLHLGDVSDLSNSNHHGCMQEFCQELVVPTLQPICLSNLNFSKLLLCPSSYYWMDMTFHLLQFSLMSQVCSERKQEFINFLSHGLARRQEKIISHTCSSVGRPFKYMLPRERIKFMHANGLLCFICVSFLKLWHEAKIITRVEHMIVTTPYTFACCTSGACCGSFLRPAQT
jgi:hypothetical protein